MSAVDPVTVICGWCKAWLSGPREPRRISHGICPKCKAEFFPDVKTPPKKANPPALTITTKERRFTGGRGEVKFFASIGGKQVGELFVNFGNAKVRHGPAASIYWIGVDESYRGQGIATKLYEAAQRLACERGRVLASDVSLKEGSRGFWEKQRAKGRASRHQEKVAGKKMFRYALSCPATSLNPRKKGRR